MKKIMIVLVLALVGFAVYWFGFRSKSGGDSGPKQQPLKVKTHSAAFNTSVSAAMDAYFEIQNALVDADTAKAKDATRKFIGQLDSIKLEELKKDTALIFETAQGNLNDVKSNATSLLAQSDITEMRRDFSGISDVLYPSFFKAISYEGPNMYWQNCPMAFGEDKGANWISSSKEILNPYLGKNHPEYKATMLHCGEVKDTIKAK